MADARTRLYCDEETQEHHSIELRKPSIISHLTCIGALFVRGKITILKKIRNIDTSIYGGKLLASLIHWEVLGTYFSSFKRFLYRLLT